DGGGARREAGVSGRDHVGVVEDVIALSAEYQFYLLVYSLSLLKDYVCVDEATSIERIAVNGEALSVRSVGKGKWVGSNDFASCDDGATSRRIRSPDELWTIGETGVEVIGCSSEIEGQARLDLLDSRELDSAEDCTGEAVIEVRRTSSDWQIIGSSYCTSVTDVEVGVA